MSVIDEVKQRVDIAEVIGQYVTLTKAGRNLRGLCPFHSEKHPSFFVYPEQQSWHCFGCNIGGDAFSFVMKKEDIGFGDVLRLLAQRVGVTIPSRFEREDKKEEKENLYQINEAAAQYFHNLLLNSPAAEKARNYVASRGFSTKTVADFQLGFSLESWESLKQYLQERSHTNDELLEAGLIVETEDGRTHDRFRGRLIFPIRDDKGRTIGFGARALDDSMPKYLNSPQTPIFDKSGTLYGLDLAAGAIRQQDTAIIVEGYIDTITAHQNGITNAVASMGTAVTEKQVSRLKRLSKNVILALDADAAGEEAMLRGVSYENTIDAEVRVIVLPEGKDPDDVIKEDVKTWQHLVTEAIPIVDYTFNMVTSKLDLTTAKAKVIAKEQLLPIIAEIKDTTRRTHYLGKLASLTKGNIRDLETASQEIKTNKTMQKPQASKPEAITRALRPIVSDSREEYCLALLLQHPELKGRMGDLLPEYFEHSENREIFDAWQQAEDISSLRDMLDTAVHEHIDSLISRPLTKSAVDQQYHDFIAKILPPKQIESIFSQCVILLREKYIKGLEAKRAEILALEATPGGTNADLAKQEVEGIEPSAQQLRELFAQKTRRRSELRR